MPFLMFSATTVPRIEPMTETPIVPPRLRKNVTALVATPRFFTSVVFCTTSMRFCMTMPTPAPSTNIETPTYQKSVS